MECHWSASVVVVVPRQPSPSQLCLLKSEKSVIRVCRIWKEAHSAVPGIGTGLLSTRAKCTKSQVIVMKILSGRPQTCILRPVVIVVTRKTTTRAEKLWPAGVLVLSTPGVSQLKGCPVPSNPNNTKIDWDRPGSESGAQPLLSTMARNPGAGTVVGNSCSNHLDQSELVLKAALETAKSVCVCVYHLYRCKTSILCRGATAHLPMLPNEATEDVVDGFMDAWTCTCILYIYIQSRPPLGAYKPQLGGDIYILSLLFYTVNVYCDYTSIYIY